MARSTHGKQMMWGKHVENLAERMINEDPELECLLRADRDGGGDFEVWMKADPSTRILVETKKGRWCERKTITDGVIRIDMCKTRGGIPDKLYPIDKFEVAIIGAPIDNVVRMFACISAEMTRSDTYPDRIQPSQTIRVGELGSWTEDVIGLVKSTLAQKRAIITSAVSDVSTLIEG